MRSLASLFAIVLLATSVSAFVSIPLTRFQRLGAYLKGLPDADRARASFLKNRASTGATTVPATNLVYVQYTTSVGISSPPTYYNLVVDTGSSNTFCGTGITIPTGETVNVTYGLGYISGIEYLDQVTLAPNLVIINQSIGDALSYADFEGVDGIIGVGPVILTQGTLSPDTNATILTVTNNAVSQGLIYDQVLGIYFAPANNSSDTNGEITYGSIDSSLYEGELTYTPVTKTFPSAYYWGINITSATYGNKIVFLKSTAGIVDTGTTQVLLADDFFDVYRSSIPGATLDKSTGLITIPPSSIPYMQPLNFTIGDTIFSMDVAAQLIPTDQNEAWGGVAGKQYGVVANLGTLSGQGLDFIIGQKFMERYYVVFDADNNCVGFAFMNNTFSKYME
ncbi:hypothetical protein M404DRAFT_8365 [Pisolithus tinctorius Marx 270]|uniref:Peptidase A1 domain-containing protein n=1 Tax=Pisolithus tinctorius Marx 270 TaxID=870435 RepID=A0A0C3JER0_PISTI|nr:hypothetical protein M404DRAFT_8365 [Pisolithus tinctorius Marx 270]